MLIRAGRVPDHGAFKTTVDSGRCKQPANTAQHSTQSARRSVHSLQTPQNMLNTTGLAVGMAIGVPALVFALVAGGFYYRQKLRYQRELEHGVGADEIDEVNDLDLDNIIVTPRDTHVKNFSKEDSTSAVDIEMDDDDQSGSEDLNGMRDLRAKRPVTISAGGLTIQKSSKVMGLRMVDKRRSTHTLGSQLNNNTNTNTNSPTKLTEKQSTENYKAYYQSMIPVFPDDDHGSTPSQSINASSASLSDMIKEKLPGSFSSNAPSTPKKTLRRPRTATTPSSASVDLYRLLEDDTPMNPKSRIASAVFGGDTPLRRSQADLQQQLHSSQNSFRDNAPDRPTTSPSENTPSTEFESPKHVKLDSLVSPFDTPPQNDKIRYDVNSENYQYGHTPGFNMDAQVGKNSSAQFDDMDDGSTHDHASFDKSPSRSNVHKRVSSNGSRIMVDDDLAEQTYNEKRRQWLDSYKNM